MANSSVTDFEKKNHDFLAALDIVFAMANGHILDQVDVDDDPELASEFKEQRDALDLIGEYLALHPVAN